MRLAHFASLLSLALPALAQVGFRDPDTIVPRAYGRAAADAASGALYVLGGRNDRVLDLWRLQNGTFARLGEAPMRGECSALAFDPVRQRLVAVLRGDGTPRHLWEFDGAAWHQHVQLDGPDQQLLHDPVRQHLLLWALPWSSSSGQLSRWDGQALTALGAPQPTGSLAFDAARGRVVVLRHDAVHEWNGAFWTTVAATQPPMYQTQAFTDPSSGRAVVLGLDGVLGTRTAHAWTGQGWVAWSLAGMPARSWPLLAGNLQRQRLQLVGGGDPFAHNDVFEFDGAGWQQTVADTGDPVFYNPRLAPIGPGTALLFDGGDNGGPVRTAIRANGVYTVVQPAHAPSPRRDFAMAGDPATGRAYLFGGLGPQGPLADFWLWNGTDWQALPGGPPARSRHAMCFDSVWDKVVLYGGTAGNDTWVFWLGQWQQHTVNFPPHVDQAHLAFDPFRRRCVLVTYGLNRREVWEWDGLGWHSTNPVHRPAGAMGDLYVAYDPVRHQVIAIDPIGGGGGTPSTTDGIAHVWDGSDWRALATDSRLARTTAVAGVPGVGLVAQAGRDRTALSLVHQHLATAVEFGAPSNAQRRLGIDRHPWLGTTYTLRYATNVGEPAVFVTGFSRTAAGAVPLPLDLGAYGMPGLQLLVSPEIVAPRPWENGGAGFEVAVPLDPSFAGVRLFHQAMMFAPHQNYTSQGIAVQFGSLW